MEPGFWQDHWQRNQIPFHQEQINPSLQAYWPRLGVSARATVFVPLCGKSRDMRWLREQGHPVLGVEIVEIAVRDFYAENGLEPKVTPQPPFRRYEADRITLLWGDYFALTAAQLADVAAVYDRAALIAFPPSLRGAYVAKLAELLPAQVRMLVIAMTYPEEQMEGPPFPVPEGEVRELYEEHFSVERLLRRDLLAESPRFRERGLTQLTTEVYRVER